MKHVLSGLIVLASLSVLAQTNKHLVIQFDGIKKEGARLTYEHPIMKDPYFDFDGLQIATSQVAFFRNNHGFFANLRNVTRSKESYALRIKEGRISQFEIIDINIYGADQLRIPQDMVQNSPLLASGEFFQYYTKNDGPITKAKFRNLRVDLGDRPETREYLNDYRTYRWLQRAVIALGVGITAGSLAVKPEDVRFTPITALGILTGASAFFFEFPKDDALRNAIDAYNK
jgi:hypothetical protein